MAKTADLNIEWEIAGKALLLKMAERPLKDDEYEVLIRLIIELEKVIQITEKSRKAMKAELETVCGTIKYDKTSLGLIRECLGLKVG